VAFATLATWIIRHWSTDLDWSTVLTSRHEYAVSHRQPPLTRHQTTRFVCATPPHIIIQKELTWNKKPTAKQTEHETTWLAATAARGSQIWSHYHTNYEDINGSLKV